MKNNPGGCLNDATSLTTIKQQWKVAAVVAVQRSKQRDIYINRSALPGGFLLGGGS